MSKPMPFSVWTKTTKRPSKITFESILDKFEERANESSYSIEELSMELELEVMGEASISSGIDFEDNDIEKQWMDIMLKMQHKRKY